MPQSETMSIGTQQAAVPPADGQEVQPAPSQAQKAAGGAAEQPAANGAAAPEPAGEDGAADDSGDEDEAADEGGEGAEGAAKKKKKKKKCRSTVWGCCLVFWSRLPHAACRRSLPVRAVTAAACTPAARCVVSHQPDQAPPLHPLQPRRRRRAAAAAARRPRSRRCRPACR